MTQRQLDHGEGVVTECQVRMPIRQVFAADCQGGLQQFVGFRVSTLSAVDHGQVTEAGGHAAMACPEDFAPDFLRAAV